MSRSSVKRYAKLAEEGRPIAPKKKPGSKPKMDEGEMRGPGGSWKRTSKNGPRRTARGHARRASRVPVRCGRDLCERVHRQQDAQAPVVQPKKRSLGAGERDEFLRAAWRMLFAGRVEAGRLVFVDEMGANVSLSGLYAWSRRGERAFGSAPRNWGKNVTLLSSITAGGFRGLRSLAGG